MIRVPSSTVIAGPSGAGKTQLLEKLLCEMTIFEGGKIAPIVYCYSDWQDKVFKKLKRKCHVKFHQGLPNEKLLKKLFPNGGLLILDDLMDECVSDKNTLDLFTKHSHHRNITVIFVSQDLYPPGRYSKTISRNVHQFFLFKQPRDNTAVRTLFIQAFPEKWREVFQIFRRATRHPFGYLMLDLHPRSPDQRRLWTCLTRKEGNPICYEEVLHDVPPRKITRRRTKKKLAGA